MKLKKEPKDIDFIINSKTWSEKDLADFRELMKKLKQKNKQELKLKSKVEEKLLTQ